MSQSDPLNAATALIAQQRHTIEQAFEIGLGVAGQFRTGFARLLPAGASNAPQKVAAVAGHLQTVVATLSEARNHLGELASGESSANRAQALCAEIANLEKRVAQCQVAMDAQADRLDGVTSALSSSQKMASRPLGTLVSLVQASDSFDQRLSHLVAAFEILPDHPETTPTAAAILAAQVDAIGGAVTDVRSQIRIALDSVSELLVRLAERLKDQPDSRADARATAWEDLAGDLMEVAAKIDSLAGAARSDDGPAATLAVENLRESAAKVLQGAAGITPLADLSGADEYSVDLEEVTAKIARLTALPEAWDEADSLLSSTAPLLAGVQVHLSDVVAHHGDVPDAGEGDLGFLTALYTMEDERSVHANTLGSLRAATEQAPQRSAGS